MALPQRKRLRLSGYDYSNQGCYFITILTDKRKRFFWEKDNQLSIFGKIVEKHILDISNHHFGVMIDNYSIMPDHIHLLLTIGCDALPDDEQTFNDAYFNKIKFSEVSDIIGAFKSSVTREIRKNIPNVKIWHRSYYDHIIVNMDDYNETWDYIESNPDVWIANHKGESL